MVCRKMEKGQEQRERHARSKLWAEKERFTLVMEELKQRITAKATKVKRYDNRINQFQDNRNFQTNQRRFFKNLEGKEERTKDATTFWKRMWSTKVEHKQDAGWIVKVKEKMPSEKQNTVNITKDDVKRKLKVNARLERSRTL